MKSEQHDALLAARGSKNCILERAYRNRPLTDEQKQRNRQHSGVGARLKLPKIRH